MVSFAGIDRRDSKVVEIEFAPEVPREDIVAFIQAVNDGELGFLTGRVDDGDIRAAFAFGGATELVDDLQPRRDRFVAVRVPLDRSSDEVAHQLRTRPGVVAAARRPMFIPASALPADPYIGPDDQKHENPPTQWYLYRCDALSAWEQTLGGGVVVADVDWGFYLEHEDLAGRYAADGLHNVLDGSDDVSMGNLTHGTGAAGMIGASANGAGIAGFAPECTLWLVQAGIVGNDGPEPPSGLVNPWATGIDWVVSRPSEMRKVINVEIQSGMLYSVETSVVVQGAVRRAVAADVFVCIPAGNGNVSADIGEDGQAIPDTGSIVVAATGYDDLVNARALFSNYGYRVSVAAPGEPDLDVTCGSASKTDYTRRYGGTSGASAKAAGAIALTVSVNDALTNADLIKILGSLKPNVSSQLPIGNFVNCEEMVGAAVRLKKQRPPRASIASDESDG